MTKKNWIQVVEMGIVFTVSASLIMYGIGKLVQFDYSRSIDKPLQSLSGMELMWSFYGYSKPYAIIIGLLQITGAILLVIPKSRLAGGFLLTAILINIILQDYFFDVHRGALLTAIFYQLLIMVIFIIHSGTIRSAIRSLLLPGKVKFTQKNVVLLAYGFCIAIVLKYLERIITAL